MRKAKTKSRAEINAQPARKDLGGNIAYSKPALRNEAFATALTDAKACLNNPKALQGLFNEVAAAALEDANAG